MEDGKWYKDGLKFTCTGCGNCCTGEPGYVWVTREEIRRISEFLHRDDGWLDKKHLRRVGFRELTEKPNGDCIFLQNVEGKRICSIYPVRPLQCRTWPFWNINLKSKRNWELAAETCFGMNTGKTNDFSSIEKIRTMKSWEPEKP